MEYGNVPHFDKPISRIVLGSVPFHSDDIKNTFELMDCYLKEGGNCVDLSHVYGMGDCQRALGIYMKDRGNRDKIVLFDKGCHHYGGRHRVNRESMISDIDDNHRNLGVTETDFFVLHRDDQIIPIGSIVEWLNEQVQEGKIKVFGGSNFHQSRIIAGNEYAKEKGLQGFSASSSHLSLASPSAPMWDDCLWVDRVGRMWYEESKFPLFSWSSGGGGFFAEIDTPDIRRVYRNSINAARLKRAKEFAKKYKTLPSTISLAWTLSQPLNIFALIGPANTDQLKHNLEALELKLSLDELNYLEFGK